MVYPKQRPEDRVRYPYSFKCSKEQDRVLRLLLLTNEQSFSSLMEDAFAAYIPTVFGVRWPSMERFHRPSTRLGKRFTMRGLSLYGVNFNREQDRVLREILAERHMTFSKLAEDALAMYIPATFAGEEWPLLRQDAVAHL